MRTTPTIGSPQTFTRFDVTTRAVPHAGHPSCLDHTDNFAFGDHHALAVAGGLAGEPDAARAAQLAVGVAAAAAAESRNAHTGVLIARAALVEQLACRRIDGNASLVVAVNTPVGIDIAWAGNCRAYVLRGDDVEQVTVDHTHGAERLAAGLPAGDHDEFFDVLTSSVAAVDGVIGRALVAGAVDRLLLCSGGVARVLTDGQVHTFLLRRQRPDAVLGELASTIRRLGAAGGALALLAEPVWSAE